MSRLIDNVLAYKILRMIVQPFDKTDAFKHGIIDAQGKTLRKSSTLTTPEEKDAYNYLNRLVFNIKKIINRFGGENKLKSLTAALWLVKEYYESGNRSTSLMEQKYLSLLEVQSNNVVLAEEQILVTKFIKEDGMGAGAVAGPANVTGVAVSTDQPKIDKKNIKKFQIMAKRKMPPVGLS